VSIDVIRSFLSRAVIIEDDKHGPCVRVTLAHGKSSGAAARLHAWAIVDGQRTQPAAQSLAREVYDVAHDHAGAFDGVQRYALAAFYGEEIEPGRTGAFRVSVDAGRDSSSAAEPTEEATGRGMLAQTMRHNEALTRFTLQSAETVTRSLAQQLGELRMENSELRTRLHDSMTAVEKAMSEQHNRELESRRFELRSVAQRELVQKIDLLFPVLLNRLSGIRALPAGPGGDTMRALVSSISQEQLQAIGNVLRPEQAVAFIDVLQGYLPPDKPGDRGNGAAH